MNINLSCFESQVLYFRLRNVQDLHIWRPYNKRGLLTYLTAINNQDEVAIYVWNKTYWEQRNLFTKRKYCIYWDQSPDGQVLMRPLSRLKVHLVTLFFVRVHWKCTILRDVLGVLCIEMYQCFLLLSNTQLLLTHRKSHWIRHSWMEESYEEKSSEPGCTELHRR